MGPEKHDTAPRTTGTSSGIDLHTEATLAADGRQSGETFPHEGFSSREGADF